MLLQNKQMLKLSNLLGKPFLNMRFKVLIIFFRHVYRQLIHMIVHVDFKHKGEAIHGVLRFNFIGPILIENAYLLDIQELEYL